MLAAAVANVRVKDLDRRSTTLNKKGKLDCAFRPLPILSCADIFSRALSDAAAVEVEHCVPEIIRAIFDAKTGSSLRVI